MKRALFAVAGFLGLCPFLSAGPVLGPEQLFLENASLNRPFLEAPSLSLQNQDRFFLSTSFGTMHATSDFLPTFSPVERRSVDSPVMLDSKDSFDNVVEMRAPSSVYFGGEIGFLYGKSTGKYGREDFQSYIIGTVGNDKFSITAGYLHQESSGRIPQRWRR